jgi:hypothetical protein
MEPNYNTTSRLYLQREYNFKGVDYTVNYHVRQLFDGNCAEWEPTVSDNANIHEMLCLAHLEDIDKDDKKQYRIYWKPSNVNISELQTDIPGFVIDKHIGDRKREYIFKFRAECDEDIEFIKEYISEKGLVGEVSLDAVFPDEDDEDPVIEYIARTTLDIEAIRDVLYKSCKHCKLMFQTVNYLHEYTGERYYD